MYHCIFDRSLQQQLSRLTNGHSYLFKYSVGFNGCLMTHHLIFVPVVRSIFSNTGSNSSFRMPSLRRSDVCSREGNVNVVCIDSSKFTLYAFFLAVFQCRIPTLVSLFSLMPFALLSNAKSYSTSTFIVRIVLTGYILGCSLRWANVPPIHENLALSRR